LLTSQTLVINYSLHARYHEIPLTTAETGNETTIRFRNAQANKDAVVDIQMLWKDKHTAEWKNATSKHQGAKGFELVKRQR
jgi:hypothetical protein